MKAGDLVTFKEINHQESYGFGVAIEKYYSSVDYGFIVLFKGGLAHVRQEELEVVSESR